MRRSTLAVFFVLASGFSCGDPPEAKAPDAGVLDGPGGDAGTARPADGGDAGTTVGPVGVDDSPACDPDLVVVVPNALWFRHQVVGAPSTRTVLVRNRGRTTVTLRSLGSLQGFALEAPDLPARLTPGDEVAIQVTFLAEKEGVSSGTVHMEFEGAPRTR